MATIEECRAALDRLSANLTGSGDAVRAATALDRSLSCRITDLDVTFVGRLAGGRIQDVTTVPGTPAGNARIRLTMSGDDLVAVVDGGLGFARAWSSGRIKVQANVRDLLRLRALL